MRFRGQVALALVKGAGRATGARCCL